MSSPRRALLLAAAVAALAFAGCSVGDDGPRTTQERDVAGFTRIDNRDSVDIRLRVGERRRVVVRAGENVIDDVDVDGIAADAFELRSDGSADIALAGTAGRLALELDGSGDADLGGLATREAQVAVSGSGSADVRAGERLEGDVDRSGDVRYHGDPALTQQVDGSGELIRAD